jgi:hypothetical protein
MVFTHHKIKKKKKKLIIKKNITITKNTLGQRGVKYVYGNMVYIIFF